MSSAELIQDHSCMLHLVYLLLMLIRNQRGSFNWLISSLRLIPPIFEICCLLGRAIEPWNYPCVLVLCFWGRESLHVFNGVCAEGVNLCWQGG